MNTVAVRQDGVNVTQNGDFDLGESRNESISITRGDSGFREPVGFLVAAVKHLTLKPSRANVGLASVPLFKSNDG